MKITCSPCLEDDDIQEPAEPPKEISLPQKYLKFEICNNFTHRYLRKLSLAKWAILKEVWKWGGGGDKPINLTISPSGLCEPSPGWQIWQLESRSPQWLKPWIKCFGGRPRPDRKKNWYSTDMLALIGSACNRIDPCLSLLQANLIQKTYRVFFFFFKWSHPEKF